MPAAYENFPTARARTLRQSVNFRPLLAVKRRGVPLMPTDGFDFPGHCAGNGPVGGAMPTDRLILMENVEKRLDPAHADF